VLEAGENSYGWRFLEIDLEGGQGSAWTVEQWRGEKKFHTNIKRGDYTNVIYF
jgi:hypothetical protein